MKTEIQKFLKKYGLRPNKFMGQHFLVSRDAAKKIIDAAEISKEDTVVEVGPGTGVLTKTLVNKARYVIAVEKDRALANALAHEMRDAERLSKIQIVAEDILKFDSRSLTKNSGGLASRKKYILIGDIPYYLTSQLLRKFLAESTHKPLKIIFMVQKEVAKRVCARAPHHSLLSLSVQIFGKPRIVANISKKDFWPEPKVDSAILTIKNISDTFFVGGLASHRIDREKFFALLKAGFGNKRKKLLNNIAKKFGTQKSDLEIVFKKCEIPLLARAQELDLEKWACIFLGDRTSKVSKNKRVAF